jgi:hypothetical protein
VLHINGDFNPRFTNKCNWPTALHTLELYGDVDIYLYNINLPESLNTLIISSAFDQEIDQVKWPASFHTLDIRYAFDQEIKDIEWPMSLHTLCLCDEFDQELINLESLKSEQYRSLNKVIHVLKLGAEFNQNLNFVWYQLEHLKIGCHYDLDISGAKFLTLEIIIDHSQKITISSCDFPTSLYKIIKGTDYESYETVYTRNTGRFTKAPHTF